MVPVKEEYNERSEAEAFHEPCAPKAGNAGVCSGEVGWGNKARYSQHAVESEKLHWHCLFLAGQGQAGETHSPVR